MQKWIIKTAFIWIQEIKSGNRRDEPMNPRRDRAWLSILFKISKMVFGFGLEI